ncbi:N(2)-acetyl-L-2,4-diaminobutanoate deacetylase DoeB2 [Wenzhouxiangella sp. AB-CW3]|uniref:N(2)-acetyl-L-2,4-diaminobutanoate deacetylase DoeB2 n=1 Tax=Wenzhouxiangella sp. AB-CW3 TaxID=2771012 RepID=UPI001CC2A36B|nr:N(2)-acetyl-L-2,4-diaminobutanoate deacetylase DoeB2 [Wenzhouxiangella sp. AB-CW3]
MSAKLDPVWQRMTDAAVDLRHALHRQPELAWQEERTAATIRARLDELGIGWRECAGTGTIGLLAADRPGRHIALRGDIDALPINEESGVEWVSERPGFMHACGHDGHTATLMAAATWLKQHEDQLPGPVSLLFQPAEEGGHGARRMIENGALDGVDAIFGWHNWPAIPYGKAVCPDGAVMAGNGSFEIVVKGRGGHSSQPEACRDPVLAGSAIVVALQQVVSRRLSPQFATVLSVTSFEAPSALTVIPDSATLRGSFRLGNSGTREPLSQLIREVAECTARAHGVDCEITVHPRYDATVNHPAEAARYRQALVAELGDAVIDRELPLPIMASEDFSYYLKKVPGAFALVGADDGNNHHHPCHSPMYDFNDRLIAPVAAVFARLAGVPVPA